MSTAIRSTPQPLFSTSRLTVFAAATVVAVAGARWLPGAQLAVPLAVAAIAVAIWHGAFDGVLAEEAFQPRFGDRWRPPFTAAYLALGGAVLLLWWRAPVVALPAFLLYSALHFGTESERDFRPVRLLAGAATGFLPIAASCHWWPQQVAAIYGMMLRGSAAAAVPITALAGRALWPAVTIALLGAVLARGYHWLAAGALLATELLLFRGCSPVVAFAVFFCLWHTPEHMLSTSLDRFGGFRRDLLLTHLRRGFVPWLLSLAGLAAACWLGRHQVGSYVGLLFIALSALTVPHMALAEICRRTDHLLPEPPGGSLVSHGAVAP